MCEWPMVVCLYVSRVYPTSCPMVVGIGSRPPATLTRISGIEWVDSKWTQFIKALPL